MNTISACISVLENLSPNFGISPLMPPLMILAIPASVFLTFEEAGPSSRAPHLHAMRAVVLKKTATLSGFCLKVGTHATEGDLG